MELKIEITFKCVQFCTKTALVFFLIITFHLLQNLKRNLQIEYIEYSTIPPLLISYFSIE